MGEENKKISKEEVIAKLKDDGDFDNLRLKIIRKLKSNVWQFFLLFFPTVETLLFVLFFFWNQGKNFRMLNLGTLENMDACCLRLFVWWVLSWFWVLGIFLEFSMMIICGHNWLMSNLRPWFWVVAEQFSDIIEWKMTKYSFYFSSKKY